jgi:hypothetical protein
MNSSVGALVALTLWFTSASGPFDNIERITPEVAAERVARCGLGPVTIRYEDELQSHILTVANAASATESQLACLDKATGWYDVELPTTVQPRFDAIREARASAIMAEEARKWLSARGLLARVPKYVRGTTNEAAFTREVETLCGPRAKGAFQSQHGFHALSPDWAKGMGLPPSPEVQEAFACLLNVTTVAGFEVGFIGNEAYDTRK